MTENLERKTYAQVMINHIKNTVKEQKEIYSGKKEDTRVS